MKNKNKKTALYRMFDKDETLLYVGISQNWFDRLNTHYSNKEWISEVTNIKLEWYKNTPSAALVERAIIRWEHPTYNIQSVIKDTAERKHFHDILFGFPEMQPDGFHKNLAKDAKELIASSPISIDSVYEWAVLNALWERTLNEEELNVVCEHCVALGNTWWMQEGHLIVCDMAGGRL